MREQWPQFQEGIDPMALEPHRPLMTPAEIAFWQTTNDKRDLQLELYKIAVQTRGQEIDRLWQRSNYLLVLNVGMAAGLCALRGTNPEIAALLAIAGFFVSLLWVVVNLGGKYWHTRWEHRTRLIERAIAPEANLLSANRTQNDEDVQASFDEDDAIENVGIIRKSHRALILTRWKPSVSEAITIASLIFVAVWAIAIGVTLCQLARSGPPVH